MKRITLILLSILILTGCSAQKQIELQKNPELKVTFSNHRWNAGRFTVPYFTDNISAIDVSYDELLTFIKEDDTDRIELPEDALTRCERYAIHLHQNAERFGIRCGYTVIIFTNNTGHAINAFHTTDKGIIYIDACRPSKDALTEQFDSDYSFDKTDDLTIDETYAPIGVFNKGLYLPMGIISKTETYWEPLGPTIRYK